MFRGRFTFTNEEQAPTSYQHQQQWQHGQMVPYREQYPTPFNSQHPMRQHHQAGDERYVRTVSFTETSTNDTGVSLQGAADRQAGQNKFLNRLLGVLCVGAVLWLVAPLLTFLAKCAIALVLLGVAYVWSKGGSKGQGGGFGGSR